MAQNAGDGSQSSQFISDFHALAGETSLDKQQNLFKLMRHSAIGKNPHELDQLVNNLHPKTHLETIIHIDLLIYFKRYDELFAKFQRGDEIAVAKLIRQQWFLQKTVANLSPQELVDNLFPTLSYPVRLRILNKLHLSEAKADDLFDRLLHKYNLYIAAFVIHQCSASHIRNTLETYSINLTVRQIKAIYVKDSQLILDYLVQKHEKDKNYLQRNKILHFLAQNNPKQYLFLVDEYQLNVKLGRKTTRTVIRAEKQQVIAKPDEYLPLFNKASLVRKLGNDFESFYEAVSKTMNSDTAKTLMPSILNCYNRKRKFALYKRVFDATHVYKFAQKPESINDDNLQYGIDAKEREKYAQIKNTDKPSDHWLQYYQAAFVFDELQQKANGMTAQLRCKYVQYATISAILNRDLETFVKIGEFVANRLQNDDLSVRLEFVNACSLHDRWNFLKTLGAAEWKVILDVIAIMNTKREYVGGTIACNMYLYLEYLTKNQRDIREALHTFENCVQDWNYVYVLQHDPKLQKKILETCLEIGHPKRPQDQKTIATYDCDLVTVCSEFNAKHYRHQVYVWTERVLKSVEFALKNENFVLTWSIHMAITYVVRSNDTNPLLNAVKALFLDRLASFHEYNATIVWFLRHNPEILTQKFEKFLDVGLVYGIGPGFLQVLRKLSHLGLDATLVEFALRKLNDENYDISKKQILLLSFSMLGSTEDFLKFTSTFETSTGKLDMTDFAQDDRNKIQLKLMKVLRNIEPYDVALETMFKFCLGDCLNPLLPGLYQKICNLPEPIARGYIEKIAKARNVSFKKHALHFSAIILDSATTLNNFQRADVNNLPPLLKYFNRKPEETLWDLIKSKLDQVDSNNSTVIKSLIAIPVQPEYASRLFDILWTFLVKFKLFSSRSEFVQRFTKDLVPKFEKEFAETVVTSSIFNVDSVDNFIFNMLFYGEPSFKFDVINLVLKTYKHHGWEVNDLKYRQRRNRFKTLIEHIWNVYMSELKNFKDAHTVRKLGECFAEFFTPSEACPQFILISLMQCKLDTPQNSARIVVDLNQFLCGKYGEYLVSILGDILKNNIHLMFKREVDIFAFCYELMELSRGRHDHFLVLNVLPKQEPEIMTCRKFYVDVLDSLRGSNDEAVQLMIQTYLQS